MLTCYRYVVIIVIDVAAAAPHKCVHILYGTGGRGFCYARPEYQIAINRLARIEIITTYDAAWVKHGRRTPIAVKYS